MKKAVLFLIALCTCGLVTIQSCGPVVVTSRLGTPPPPWFYPNRVETVRYIYFPEYQFYYDISLRNYIYLNNGAWVTVNMLPSHYRNLNLRRSKQVRITNYYGDDIKRYHNESVIQRRLPTSKRN
jgi:hypothetical protein